MDHTDTAAKLIIARTEAYLSDTGRGSIFKRNPVLRAQVAGLTDDALKEWALASKGQAGENRYLQALEIMGGDTVLQTLMDLCVASFMWPDFPASLAEETGYGPCLHLAAEIEGRDGLSFEEIRDLAERARRILDLDFASDSLQYARAKADERLLGFLSGSDEITRGLSELVTLYDPGEKTLQKPCANQEIIKDGAAHLRNGGKVLALTGRGGRRFITRHIAKITKKSFLSLNIRDLIKRAEKEGMPVIRDMLIRETYFLDAGICLYGFDDTFIMGKTSDRKRGRRDMEALCGILFLPFIREGIPLVLCIDDPSMVPAGTILPRLKCLALPESFSFDERKRLWQGLFDENDLKLDASSFASRYRMNPKEAAGAVTEFLKQEETDGAKEERFARISIESINNKDTGPGRIIYSDLRLDDVKLKESTKRILSDTVNAVLSGPLVLDEWGLEKKYPYGRGVSLLMAGPPGTGKTMSANAIAGELSLPLYQVNLSNTVDKYIGETEKNLEKAFAFAEKNNAILFFDEADALFGTRSEVHDAKDRYANTEISYLLQRMEAFDGIVVMATNIKGNIDPAFMRRIRYVAHFENPDEELRRIIWETCLTEGVPHEEIDTAYLASQFDNFTGSIIKTVFLNACVRAAGDKEKLSMKHLIYAIRQEKEKESTVSFSSDALGKYAYLV